jgi:hypothetical protein
MLRSKVLFAAAAVAAGFALGGGAQAATFAPVKVQASAVEALSPLIRAGHRWRHRMQMYGDGYGYGYRRHDRHFAFSHRRHHFRPYLYEPFLYGFGYGGGYGYDPYSYGLGSDYGDSGYGYGNCNRRSMSYYWGY